VTGLSVKNRAVRQLWGELFPASTPITWDTSKLASSQSQLLESMVGLKVPPWIVAAGIVCAYVLLVLLIQLVSRQGKRPAGFAAAVALSILIAIGLLVFSFFRDNTVKLSMARIDLLDLDHGGARHEAVTLLGPESSNFPIGVVPGASLSQAPSSESKPLDLTIAPLRADASVFPRRIERVWQAAAAIPVDQTLHATGRFDATGLALSVDNRIGDLSSPVLIGTSGRFNLAPIPNGASTLRADDAGSNRAAVQLDQAQLRGRILDAAMTSGAPGRPSFSPQLDDTIYLAGWLTQAPPPLLQLPADRTPALSESNALARTRVQIEPSPVGSTVHIASAFTQMITGDIAAIPYDATRKQWIEAFQPTDFFVGFAFPAGIGHVKTTRVTLDVQSNTPQHTLTFRRGQVERGRVEMNPGGPVVASWSKMIGSNSVTFDVAPGDVDANGWVWLMVSVEGPAVQSRWNLQNIAVSYDGMVDGPPQPAVLPAREPPRAPAREPARPAVQKKKTPTPKKPKPKPAPKKKASQPQ
jgi:hypothetical protein